MASILRLRRDGWETSGRWKGSDPSGARGPRPEARIAPNSVELGGDELRIGSQGIQPVDDEAPQPGVGAVNQQREDLLGFPMLNRGHRRTGPGARQVRP